MRTSLYLIAFALAASPALADTPQAMPLTYDAFEVSIGHVDLETCPPSLAAEEVFCRATLASEQIHVFVFAEAGDSPLVGFASFDADTLPGLLK